jgi:hypothetical protein
MTASKTYIHVMEEFHPDHRESAEERIRAARAQQRDRRTG